MLHYAPRSKSPSWNLCLLLLLLSAAILLSEAAASVFSEAEGQTGEIHEETLIMSHRSSSGSLGREGGSFRLLQDSRDDTRDIGDGTGWLAFSLFAIFLCIGSACFVQQWYDRRQYESNSDLIPHEERLRRQIELQRSGRYGIDIMEHIRESIGKSQIDPDTEKRARKDIEIVLDQTKVKVVLLPENFLNEGEGPATRKSMKDTSVISEDSEESKTKSADHSSVDEENPKKPKDEECLPLKIQFECKRLVSGTINGENCDVASSKVLSFPNLCAICLEPYQGGQVVAHASTTLCSHAFHRECISEYLTLALISKRDEQGPKDLPCPCCRQTFASTSMMNSSAVCETAESEGGGRPPAQPQTSTYE